MFGSRGFGPRLFIGFLMVDTRFFPSIGPVPLGELLAKIGIDTAHPDLAARAITGASEPELTRTGDIALLASRKYADGFAHAMPSAIIVAAGLEDALPDGAPVIAVSDPHLVFAQLLDLLYPDSQRHLASAFNEQTVKPHTETDVVIADNAAFGPDVEIGRNSIICPGAVIGRGVKIGRNCVIGANASIECAYLGDSVYIHAGVRIGTEGFGWLDQGRTNRKVPQLGRVIIQDRVEIGANSTVDRGALGDTVIGEGTKLDNLVQIGHNCRIGRNCLIAATTGISGSTIIGDGVLMGGGVGTSGHLSIGAGSVVYGRAAVTKDWPAGSKLAGAPAQEIKDFWRELALLRRLGKGV